MENPVTCKVTDVSIKQGKSKCLWSSCQEGCTREMFQCYQVRVQYVDVDYKNNTTVDEFHESAWIKLSHYENFENEVRFLNQRHKAKYIERILTFIVYSTTPTVT